jgi:hypothetical protein
MVVRRRVYIPTAFEKRIVGLPGLPEVTLLHFLHVIAIKPQVHTCQWCTATPINYISASNVPLDHEFHLEVHVRLSVCVGVRGVTHLNIAFITVRGRDPGDDS